MIELQGIHFQLRSGSATVHLLSELCFAADGARFVAITGPSGSGKSTLLAIAGGLLTPTAGEARFRGVSIYGLDHDARTALRLRSFGWVMQKPLLLPGVSAEENAALPALALGTSRRVAMDRARGLLEQMGLERQLRLTAEKLSGGEAARVSLCRALMNSPSILFADEPTASLDSDTAKGLIGLLRDVAGRQHCMVMAVTHDQRLADVADIRLELRDGRLQAR